MIPGAKVPLLRERRPEVPIGASKLKPRKRPGLLRIACFATESS